MHAPEVSTTVLKTPYLVRFKTHSELNGKKEIINTKFCFLKKKENNIQLKKNYVYLRK